MKDEKHNDPLLEELDSLKGLLEAHESDLASSIDGLQMRASRARDQSNDPAANLREKFRPEAYLAELDQVEIPTLEDAVETKRNGKKAKPDVTRANEPGIPVLKEAVSKEDIRQKAPDALGATSWQELEAIVDLLVERRLTGMRETLKKELLGEFERHTGLEPPT